MPNIQIKDVPLDVHATLRRRAADAHQSLQEYLLAFLTETAREPTLDEVLDRISRRRGGASVPLEAITRMIREDRDSH